MSQPDLWKAIYVLETAKGTAEIQFIFIPHDIVVFNKLLINTLLLHEATDYRENLNRLYLDQEPDITLSINDHDMGLVMESIIRLNTRFTVTENEEVGFFSEADMMQVMLHA